MVLSNELLEMNPVELGDVSGGALKGMQIMYVSPDASAITTNTPVGGLGLPIGSVTAILGVVTAMAYYRNIQ